MEITLEVQNILNRHERGYTSTIYGTKEEANAVLRHDMENLVRIIKNHGVSHHVSDKSQMSKSNIELLEWKQKIIKERYIK